MNGISNENENATIVRLIRLAGNNDFRDILEVINAAAVAYKGVIPDDRWRDPYMAVDELEAEIDDGVEFWLADDGEQVLGVMGLQPKQDVALIRHAYVRPSAQRRNVGSNLLTHVINLTQIPLLVGTWADALWALEFYLKHDFSLVPATDKDHLLKKYWSVPHRQIETSVVLADKRFSPN